MACFAAIDVSQGSVATYARCGGIFNNHLTTNLPRNLSVKFFFQVSVQIFSQSCGHESVAPLFGPPGIANSYSSELMRCNCREYDYTDTIMML